MRPPAIHRDARKALLELDGGRCNILQRRPDYGDRLIGEERRIAVDRLPLLLFEIENWKSVPVDTTGRAMCMRSIEYQPRASQPILFLASRRDRLGISLGNPSRSAVTITDGLPSPESRASAFTYKSRRTPSDGMNAVSVARHPDGFLRRNDGLRDTRLPRVGGYQGQCCREHQQHPHKVPRIRSPTFSTIKSSTASLNGAGKFVLAPPPSYPPS